MTEQSFAQATGGLRFLETMQNFLVLLAAIGFTSAVHVVAPGAVVVQPYTNYPASTAPLVHAPVVHTPVVAAYAAHPWTGLVHALKKRDLFGLGPWEHPYNAARKVAQAVQVHNEGVRNTVGVIPWGSPADTLDVAVTKQAHLHQVAAEGVRNTFGVHPWTGVVHALKKRDLYGLGPWEHPYNAARKVAQAVQVHNEGVRNTVGVIPWGSPADTLDVAVTKQAHLHQVAAEGVRNTFGVHPWTGVVHALKKRDLYGLGPWEHPYNAARKVAQAVQVHNEGVRNTVGVIPWGSPADTLDVAVTKQAHLHQVATEGVRNTLGVHPWLHVLKKRSPLVFPVVPAVGGFSYHTTTYAHPLLSHTLVHL